MNANETRTIILHTRTKAGYQRLVRVSRTAYAAVQRKHEACGCGSAAQCMRRMLDEIPTKLVAWSPPGAGWTLAGRCGPEVLDAATSTPIPVDL